MCVDSIDGMQPDVAVAFKNLKELPHTDVLLRQESEPPYAPPPGVHYFCCFFSRRRWCRYGDRCIYTHNNQAELQMLRHNGILVLCERMARFGECKHRASGRHP